MLGYFLAWLGQTFDLCPVQFLTLIEKLLGRCRSSRHSKATTQGILRLLIQGP